jgi:hypothetical protein
MKGQLVCRCVICGLEKGDRDSNSGWWIFVPRDVHPKLRTDRGLNFCPTCAAAPLIRSDEAQANASPGESRRWRIVPVQWLYGLMLLASAAAADNPEVRASIGWRMVAQVAGLIGFKRLPSALPLIEFGFIPEEVNEPCWTRTLTREEKAGSGSTQSGDHPKVSASPDPQRPPGRLVPCACSRGRHATRRADVA